MAYRTSDPYSGYAAFVGLGTEKLIMYIMASDDNPFDTANFGQIRAISIEPETPKWEKYTFLFGFLLILLAVLW